MNMIIELLRQFFISIRPWLIVAPWEQSVRVRAGKHVRLLSAGVHLRIPVLDINHIQSTRTRVTWLPKQTLSTTDGKVVSLMGAVSYSITDIGLLYNSMHHAEDTLRSLAMRAIADDIFVRHSSMLSADSISQRVTEKLQTWNNYGLGNINISVVEMAVVKSYRLIGDQGVWSAGTSLSTEGIFSQFPR